MNTRIIAGELRRLADNIEATFSRTADAQLEQHLKEVRRRFIESFRKTHGLEHLDPEKIWERMKDEIRMEIKQRPMDWKA